MINAFLYRRLARLVTCVLKLPTGGSIFLRSKYDTASVADVFIHPFYWQIFNLIDKPPSLVVDCGAHCGHFSILSHICSKIKFGKGPTNFLLIEPNVFLKDIIKKNFCDACVSGTSQVITSALGGSNQNSTTKLFLNPRNFLSSTTLSDEDGNFKEVPLISLGEILKDHPRVDILKVDIEGSEFNLMQNEPFVFSRANIVLMEIHWNFQTGSFVPEKFFADMGFCLINRCKQSENQELFLWKR